MPVTGLDSLHYALGKPDAAGIFKKHCDDFCVDEILGFEFSNEGDHVCLQIKKENLTTFDVCQKLARAFSVSADHVSYAGVKDRRGICSQWFSVKVPGIADSKLEKLAFDGVEVLAVHRNSRKIKIGSHQGNRFKILLREVTGEIDQFQERALLISQQGIPNYFGQQRFGHDMANVHSALELMSGSRTDRANRGKRAAAHKRFQRGMLISAARAYVFNHILSRRVDDKSWCRYIEGDVLNLDGTNRYFSVTEDQPWDDSLQNRLQAHDIHPTGLLPGIIEAKDKYVASGQAQALENVICEDFSPLIHGLEKLSVAAGRRTLRVLPRDFSCNTVDNNSLELQFTLSRGSYATSVLRELCVVR